MTAAQTREAALGSWESLATELRPGSTRNADGSMRPFFLRRKFILHANDSFALTITNYADASGNVPLARIHIEGHVEWKGQHPVAEGAQQVNFIADKAYTVTPLLQAFADVLNQHTAGFATWRTGEAQSILRKAFAPFGLNEGQLFKEYDLIYVSNDMLFWGARHIDGRGFDTDANRPANLQVPMKRV